MSKNTSTSFGSGLSVTNDPKTKNRATQPVPLANW